MLDTASEKGIDLTVYTSGRHLKRLEHDAVKRIILHLFYQGEKDDLVRDFKEGNKPDSRYMEKINALFAQGKEVQLRTNFTDRTLWEQELVFAFYHAVERQYHSASFFKYSVTTGDGSGNSSHFTPSDLREAAPNLYRSIYNKIS